MPVSDTIGDLLTRIRNAKNAEHKYVDVALSKLNQSLIQVLKDNGYITDFLVNEKIYKIRVFLKYLRGTTKSVIYNMQRVSTPGRRTYVGFKEIPKVSSGLGIAILSTPLGLLEGEEARKRKTGGELLCIVW